MASPLKVCDGAAIRFATREDIPTILSLIKELAAYEHESDSVRATESSLASSLSFAPSAHRHQPSLHDPGHPPSHALGEQPPADARDLSNPTPSRGQPTQNGGYARTLLITAPEGEVAGMALYFHNYSTWRAKPGIFLEDLFVRPRYRRRGYGRALIRELAAELVRIEGGRLEWSCLKWNEPSLKFYESLGARRMNEWVGLRVDGQALIQLAKGEEEPTGEEEPIASA